MLSRVSESKRSRLGWQLPLIVYGVFVLYVLSIGPAEMLLNTVELPNAVLEFADAFYRPLGYLQETFPPMAAFMEWYLELWWRLLMTLDSIPAVTMP